MMYRLLKDLIDWKCNLYIKCKLEKFRYATLSSTVFLSLFLLVSLDLVHCSSLSNNVGNGRGRTLYEHGIFRHDKPWDSISPPRSDSDKANNDDVHHNADHSVTISPPDNRDKYTYDRFKRSVTTLNFHPKPKNLSSSGSGIKPLRIFKYVTEDDVLQPSGPSHSENHHHQTIFRPFMKNESEHNVDINHHSARVVGGAKVNLKAKLDKDIKKENLKNKSNQVIRSSNDSPRKEANHQNDSTGDSESKSQPKIIPTPSRPENILIFKPSLAIRKNKTSLIPSGKFAKLNNANIHLNQVSNGVSNSITAAISTKQAQALQQQQQGEPHEEESTDPNSSTVNDRSLIHNYFDSVVVLNEEEGQKQLRQGGYHREKTSNSDDVVDNGVGSGGDDDHDEEDEIKNTMSEVHSPHPPTSEGSSFSFTSVLAPNSNADTRGSRGSVDEMKNLMNAENKKVNSPSLPIMRNSTNGSFEIHTMKINGTITGKKNKVIVQVKRKSRQRHHDLAVDDVGQDGSERSRRSPSKVNPRFQQHGNRQAQINMKNLGGQEQLQRAALFRRNTAIMMTPRMRQLNPAMTKKVAVAPRIITSGSSGPFARTIIPMKPIPVMHVVKKSVGSQKLQFMPSGGGPIGPGPVGPPLAAIKVMPMTQNRNIFIQQTPVTNPSAPPLPITPQKDMMTGASRMIYNFKPLPEGLVLNQAASSYYSPTYRKFQKGFEDQISGIMEGGSELEDTVNTWEESRPPRRQHRHHHARPRSRSSGRHRHHRHHRPRHEHHRHHHHSPHRSGAHSQHPHHRPSPTARGKKLGNPKYTYPKNAESIQDILNYFEKDGPPQPRGRNHGPPERSGPMNPKRQQSSIPSSHNPHNPPGPEPSYTKLADLSGEFRDVHASLLKDIKEFAKRPNMFSSSSDTHARHHSHKKSPHRDSMEGNGFFFDPIDEIFNPQPKPVRDMIKQKHNYDEHGHAIKPDLYSLENIRERIALKRGKLGGRQNKEKDQRKDTHSFQFDPPPHTDNEDDYYDQHRPSKHTTSEGGYSGEQVRNFNSREDYDFPYKNSPCGKDSGGDCQALFPNADYKQSSFSSAEWKAIQDAEFAAKSHITSSTRKPIVLKRPNDDFRLEQKKKAEREYYMNAAFGGKSPTTLNLDSPLVLKSPQSPTVLQPFSYNAFNAAAAAQAQAHAMKPVSEEEDIVEIHTGGPGMPAASGVPSYTSDSHHMKQERLKKMYMDVLQQKLQLEAALLQPQALPSTLHHPGMQMHTSTSLLPQLQQQFQQFQQQQQQLQQQQQHSHLQLPRVSMSPGLAFSPSTIVTHAPLTGMGLPAPRRKKPMRMKIHIYPNGNDGIEQGIEAANMLAAAGFGTSGFSASNPPPSVLPPPNHQSPHQDMNKMSESAIPSGPTGPHPTSPSGYGATAPMPHTVGAAVKNKNVVLHLHVHRRNDQSGALELETEGSSPVGVTAMPPKLTYKQIYDEQMKSEHQHNLQNHRMMEEEEERSSLNSSPQEGREPENHNHDHHHHHHEQVEQDEEEDVERDKSISMEAPIHDEKIENVFHTIMKLRKRPASDVGSTAEDNRKKRNRN